MLHADTFAIEKELYNLMQADVSLWTELDSGNRVFEGAVPRGIHLYDAGIVGLIKDVTLGEYKHTLDGAAPMWAAYDYEVTLAWLQETYGGVLATNAELLYTTLHNQRVDRVADGVELYFVVVGNIKRRVNRDGRIWKELGFKVRVGVQPTGQPYFPGQLPYLEFRDAVGPGLNFLVHPLVHTIRFFTSYDPVTTVKKFGFEMKGYYNTAANALPGVFTYALGSTAFDLQYGVRGNAVGEIKIDLANQAFTTSFTMGHDGPLGVEFTWVAESIAMNVTNW